MIRRLALFTALAGLFVAAPAEAKGKHKAKRCIDVSGQVLEGVSSKKVCKQMGGKWKTVKVKNP